MVLRLLHQCRLRYPSRRHLQDQHLEHPPHVEGRTRTHRDCDRALLTHHPVHAILQRLPRETCHQFCPKRQVLAAAHQQQQQQKQQLWQPQEQDQWELLLEGGCESTKETTAKLAEVEVATRTTRISVAAAMAVIVAAVVVSGRRSDYYSSSL